MLGCLASVLWHVDVAYFQQIRFEGLFPYAVMKDIEAVDELLVQNFVSGFGLLMCCLC